jgi:hypothetical protein
MKYWLSLVLSLVASSAICTASYADSSVDFRTQLRRQDEIGHQILSLASQKQVQERLAMKMLRNVKSRAERRNIRNSLAAGYSITIPAKMEELNHFLVNKEQNVSLVINHFCEADVCTYVLRPSTLLDLSAAVFRMTCGSLNDHSQCHQFLNN